MRPARRTKQRDALPEWAENHAREQLLADVYAMSPVATVLLDECGTVLDLNPAAATLLGVDAADRARGVPLFAGTDLPAEVEEGLRHGHAARCDLAYDFDCAREIGGLPTRHSGQVWVEVHISPLRAGPPGSPARVVQLVDSSERKRAEAELRLQALVLDQITEHVTVTDLDGTITYVNRVQADTIGQAAANIVGRSTVIYGEDPGRGATQHEIVERTLRDGSWRGEIVNYAADGSELVVDCRTQVIRDQRGTPVALCGVASDITERRRMEATQEKLRAELFQAQKMEAIGTLAGGVAHDFNNILGGVLGGLSLLELHLDAGSEAQAIVKDMEAMVERGADLARQLLGFARRGKFDAKPLDLAQVVREASTMFGRTRRDLTFAHDFAPDLLAVLMDHAQLEQVLLNLFLNAGQAMPGGGRISVRAENEPASPEAEAGRFVKLVVADTGVGMDGPTMARIFEPFFTTKAPGLGSGIGLASVWGIVTNHGGSISVASAPGQGSTFTILLPATTRPAEVTPTPEPPVRSGKGTVLVVDDEQHLLGLLSRMLEAIGYDVLTAAGGREALEQVRRHQGRLSLVLLDLTMPGMSGGATFDALRAIAPQLRVLLVSGYSAEGEARELLARGCDGFIQKPFKLAALAAKIESLV